MLSLTRIVADRSCCHITAPPQPPCNMAEVINEQLPRVKFELERLGEPTMKLTLDTPELQASCIRLYCRSHQCITLQMPNVCVSSCDVIDTYAGMGLQQQRSLEVTHFPQALILLIERMEQLGAAPVLNDDAVGGNCGILVVSLTCHSEVRALSVEGLATGGNST